MMNFPAKCIARKGWEYALVLAFLLVMTKGLTQPCDYFFGGCEYSTVGPVLVDVIYYSERKQTNELSVSSTNQTSSPIQRTVGTSTTQTWSWSINGGGQFGAELATGNFGFNIGYTGVVNYTTQMSSTIPPMSTGYCQGCPSAGVPRHDPSSVVYTHHYDLVKEHEDTYVKRFSYYYSVCPNDPLNLGNAIRSCTSLGWASRNDFPVKRENVCESKATSGSCLKSRYYQYPFTLHLLVRRFTPETTCFTNSIGTVDYSNSIFEYERLCYYDEP